MKKTKLSVLSLAVIAGVLASCNNETALRYERPSWSAFQTFALDITKTGAEPIVSPDEHGEIIKINDPNDPEAASRLTSLSFKESARAMFYKGDDFETYQSAINYAPYSANISNLTYSTSNEDVAVVDKNGLITATGEGACDITVTSANGLSDKMHITVNNNTGMVNWATGRRDQIKAAQNAAGFEGPSKMYLGESYSSKRVNMNDDVVMSENIFEEKFWFSKDEAYFRIVENDYEVKVPGGSLVPGKVDYIFYTTKDFYSYAFKTSTTKKNYMRIDQSSLISTGNPFNGLLEVLDNFFTSGKAIVENQIEAIYGQDLFSNSLVWSNLVQSGRFSADKTQLAIESDVTNNYRVGPDQEDDFGMPAYTPFTVNDKTRALWEDNLLTYKSIDEIWEWEIDGVTYQDQNSVYYEMDTKDVEFLYPDISQYNKVDTIFDL